MGRGQFTPSGDLGEDKLCLSPVLKADSEHRDLFSQNAQDETKGQTLPEESPWWDKKVPGVCSRGQIRGARGRAQTG